ncbi:adenosylcobinamide amidohydrolase [Desulfogranum mediterraneum]|uniref:adenosylcobinamide amidohydrolase n=1 Tax=Desulfogranum mediterraneum TaxID=160661 RepID=UPI0003F8AA6C|nr:adenosylcobinamide amidohydrolase [Desulfogranum mediterraneum]
MKNFLLLLVMMFFLLPAALKAESYPLSFVDSGNQQITLNKPPQRVVSLVPSVTEILLRIGAAEVVSGITYHSQLPPESGDKAVVGGFFRPDLERVASLKPDTIFYSSLQQGVVARFGATATLIRLAPRSIAESFAQIALLGRMFHREEQAEEVIAEEQRRLELIAAKIRTIPQQDHLRVMRLMGRDQVMTPGDDSFQQEFIRAAGGIPPTFGKSGTIVPVELSEWQAFNPQVLYGCGNDRTIMSLLEEPGWREVEAVQNRRIYFFPCELTCRAATQSGYFVSWLAARLYRQQFGEPAAFVLPQQVVAEKPLDLDLDYVREAGVVESDIKDFRNRTLVVRLKTPMAVLSTLEGPRSGITTVLNHYFPPPSWGLGHNQGLEALRRETLEVLGLEKEKSAALFTGADIDNLAVARESFKAMEVTALVTAGVSSNAVRMGHDSGAFYEPDQEEKSTPGTINVLLFTNMELSSRAMSRALITATEAKAAALQELDIRSSYSPLVSQATGTGTDNIIVVQGRGYPIDASGGHTKMGELIARAVYKGVQEAIRRQNGLAAQRSIFQRLKERRLDLQQLCRLRAPEQAGALHQRVERILLEPRYSDFIKATLALSDQYEQGLLEETSAFSSWAQSLAAEIAGGGFSVLDQRGLEQLPRMLGLGMAAIFTGAELSAGIPGQ